MAVSEVTDTFKNKVIDQNEKLVLVDFGLNGVGHVACLLSCRID